MAEENVCEKSRHVTIYHQLKETVNSEPGDRSAVHGEHFDDRYRINEGMEGFEPVARPIAIIDIGVEITEDELTEWCNSYAGKVALEQFWPDLEVDDPTLPDCEEYLNTNNGQSAEGE